MTGTNSRVPVRRMLSLPLGVILAVFFFLPWLDVECAGPGPGPGQSGPERIRLGSASGWQLTTGGLTVDREGFRKLSDETDHPRAPTKKEFVDSIQARPWFAPGLIVPVFLVLLGIVGMSGRLASKTLGRLVILAAVVGAVTVLLAPLTVNYTNDLMPGERRPAEWRPPWSLPPRPSWFVTTARVWLWLSLGLYVAAMFVGMTTTDLPAQEADIYEDELAPV